ncbi:MAG: sigma-70 family RNA polymerase sigma factor [Pirellulaceae bacterium]|nr:sigma-70 family RNA polymerase sigma factor [Pirellulaceae bacterium]
MNTLVDSTRNEDAGLWQRVLAGEPAAFEEVVTKYQNLVAAVAYSSTGNFALSEEVTQETFWQAWRQRFQLRDHSRLAPWLCGIARNLAAQTSKRESRHAAEELIFDFGSTFDDPVQNSISTEERAIVWETLAEIPETYREALVLFYREGHSMAEVAAALDVSVDVAKQRVHRGRELLRATLATRVEDVLVRSRPGRSLTTKVMVGMAALGASLKATASAATASAATVGATTAGTFTATEIAKAAAVNTAGGAVAATVKSAAMTGAAGGLLGGLVGAAGGLGGAYLGSFLPAQMAETMAERKLLEKHGRRTFAAALIFTAIILVQTLLLFIPGGLFWYFLLLVIVTLVFVATTIILAVKTQWEVQKLRAGLAPDAEPNPSPLRRKIIPSRFIYRGRRFTSRWRLFGVPLIDIQFSDVFAGGNQAKTQPGKAFGWVAIGDRATGLLFAAGGLAKGLIAIGGLAIGGIAFGGGAVGVLAIGGGALGVMAFGGLAVGYEAVGGGAIAWHVATGGGAIAGHLAVGGGAWAQDFAVGGDAWAAEANTELAKELAQTKSKIWMIEWMAKNQLLYLAVILTISFLPMLLLRFVYRKELREGLIEEK